MSDINDLAKLRAELFEAHKTLRWESNLQSSIAMMFQTLVRSVDELLARAQREPELVEQRKEPMGIFVVNKKEDWIPDFIDPREIMSRQNRDKVYWFEIETLCRFAIGELRRQGSKG